MFLTVKPQGGDHSSLIIKIKNFQYSKKNFLSNELTNFMRNNFAFEAIKMFLKIEQI